MSELEDQSDAMLDVVLLPEESASDDVDYYMTARYFSYLSTGIAAIAMVESIVGMETASSLTFNSAGAMAVGAAYSGIAGLFAKKRNS